MLVSLLTMLRENNYSAAITLSSSIVTPCDRFDDERDETVLAAPSIELLIFIYSYFYATTNTNSIEKDFYQFEPYVI